MHGRSGEVRPALAVDMPWPGRLLGGAPATVPARRGDGLLGAYMTLEIELSQPTEVSLRQALYLYPLLIWNPLV